MIDWTALRARMVEGQLIPRHIGDERVLAAMRKIPRHVFVGPGMEPQAYSDHALPIGHGQTISQPFMVALMTQELRLESGERVLEIGTGSGYQTAVLAELAQQVFSVERLDELAKSARKILEDLGYVNVAIMTGDGTIGWKEFKPYDRILVTAGAPRVPESLVAQLADPGLMVIPVGSQGFQELVVIRKNEGAISEAKAGGCVFVPLLGKEAW